jgi:hypothetical protein
MQWLPAGCLQTHSLESQTMCRDNRSTARITSILVTALTLASPLAMGQARDQDGPAQDVAKTMAESLPDKSLSVALSKLELVPADATTIGLRVPAFIKESVFHGLGSEEKPLRIPLQARRQLLLLVHPRLAADGVHALLKEHEVSVVRVMPDIGILVVQIAESQEGEQSMSVRSLEELRQSAVARTIERLSKDQRVLAVAPNSVLTPFMLKSAAVPNLSPIGGATDSAEREDWGIADAHISEVWPRLQGPFSLGVIDVGFSKHKDLKLLKGLPVEPAIDAHGTHVSGIACAQHNEIGVRGVLRDCTVVYAGVQNVLSGSDQVEGFDSHAWSNFFAEFISALGDFIRANPNVKVVNLSVGYNWGPGYSIDPRNDVELRNTIRAHALMVRQVLLTAAASGVALVSAAGNDSAGLPQPLEARWASPFNAAIDLMKKHDKWSNGLIVQSHDKNGLRPRTSNVGADISCPGEEILSTVPGDSIALESGTSMAAPYCAGALLALRNVLPTISLETAMRCIRLSDKSTASVPRLNLKHAIDHCVAN